MTGEVSDAELRELLQPGRRVAVVGLSPKPDRDSHRVAAYLQAKGFRVLPVHPKAREILGEPVYARLEEVPPPVDMVYIFRKGSEVLPFVETAAGLRPLAVWLPLGVTSPEAVEVARRYGFLLVMDRCMMIEHARLAGES
ncbi:MAG: CoA-binding protein [Bacillota bacterium]